MIKNIIALFFFSFTTLIFAQKRSLTHDDYDFWKSITDTKISNSGKLIVSVIETATKRGDGYIEIYNTESNKKFTFFNGYDSSITEDESFVVFKRKPKYETVRKEKKKKLKKDKTTKDDLFVYDVKANKIYDSITRVSSYKVPDDSNGWLVIEKFKNKKPEKKKKDTLKAKAKDTVKLKLGKAFKQNYALVYDLNTRQQDTILQIKDFVLSEKGKKFYYTKKDEKKKKKDIGVFEYDIVSKSKFLIDSTRYIYNKLSVDKSGEHFSFIAAKDSTHVDSLQYELFYYKNQKLTDLVDVLGKNLRNNWELEDGQTPFFSENGSRLYFYSKPKVQFNQDTTLLEDEIPQVDVWNWKDKMIQPEQNARF